MNSIILKTTSKILLPVLMIFSFFLLLRGHNEPGGGFIGGLVASAGIIFYTISYGTQIARELIRVNPFNIIASGLFIAIGSAIYSLFLGELFMTGKWTSFALPVIGKIGTPLIFDVGVYLVVIGITINIIFTLEEDES